MTCWDTCPFLVCLFRWDHLWRGGAHSTYRCSTILGLAASRKRGRVCRGCSKQEAGFLLETRVRSTLWAQRKRSLSFGERGRSQPLVSMLVQRCSALFPSPKSTLWHITHMCLRTGLMQGWLMWMPRIRFTQVKMDWSVWGKGKEDPTKLY